MRHAGLITLYALAITVAVITIRIETLNAAAGYYLPRTLPEDIGKWREWPSSEKWWRQVNPPRGSHGERISREYTPAEQRRMAADIARGKANNRLRDWVGTAGVFQYLLLPTLAIASLLSLAARPTRRRLLVLTPIGLILVFATASLWYRQYIPSLGW